MANVKYRTIVVDPPWSYTNKWNRKEDWASKSGRMFKIGTDRGAATQYPCLTWREIALITVGQWAEDDAHLYLWTTNAFMVEAHSIAKAWGFAPKTILTWCKPQIGMGSYYRNTTEHALFCVRGRLTCQRKDVPTHFTADRKRHSEKPAAFYDIVESMSPGPYLDVFARKLRFNWTAWGNEVYNVPGLPQVGIEA